MKYFVAGAQFRVTPIAGLAQARELLRPVRCRVIDDCGHMAPYELAPQTSPNNWRRSPLPRQIGSNHDF